MIPQVEMNLTASHVVMATQSVAKKLHANILDDTPHRYVHWISIFDKADDHTTGMVPSIAITRVRNQPKCKTTRMEDTTSYACKRGHTLPSDQVNFFELA
jgi:hypothetical protein